MPRASTAAIGERPMAATKQEGPDELMDRPEEGEETARATPIWVTAPTRERAVVPEAITPSGMPMSRATVSPATA